MEGDGHRVSPLIDMVRSQKAGIPSGIYSVCSANRSVLEACMLQAKSDGSILLVESTSNQVNQYGGYMRMEPQQFVSYVRQIAESVGLPSERVVLGGDHLGPNVWQSEPEVSAMEKSRELVRRYVLAGYEKIHLDASMRLADDPGDKHTPLTDEVVAGRAADLCAVSEAAYAEGRTGARAPLYVIGTEVPIPGGAQEAEDSVAVTKVEDAKRTIEVTREAFYARGLESAWDRVIAVVVQPGVEFGDDSVFDYQHEKARALSSLIEAYDGLVYEAHSTDYQTNEALKRMVEDHFAILKVGPALTFAFREAVFALESIEMELLGHRSDVTLSHLRSILDQAMLDNPVHWKKHYHGDEHYKAFARKYSYSDRCRYYWVQPQVEAALSRLLSNLALQPIPMSLLSQFMPLQYWAVRAGAIDRRPASLVHHAIQVVAGGYAWACGTRRQVLS